MNVTYESVVENIRGIIREKGIKQDMIAKRIGLSQQELDDVLNNYKKKLKVKHLKLIADALEVNINEIFRLTDANTDQVCKSNKRRDDFIE